MNRGSKSWSALRMDYLLHWCCCLLTKVLHLFAVCDVDSDADTVVGRLNP